ncbi:hypothetical protein [Lacticaseibacillus jixiensis]|uniref:hypothetical protein n=1 Tax=Lacticaseibacillus jixiensis TaxID=3231926 RepID=UPI0036F318C1
MSDMLYHYTSADTLEKVLQNRTFRLTSLPLVDDEEEELTQNFGSFGRYAYVSSWTELQAEKHELWSTYTSDLHFGVRIGLPKNIFLTTQHTPLLPSDLAGVNVHQNALQPYPYTVGIQEIESAYGVYAMIHEVELFPVTYTENPELIEYRTFDKYGNTISVNQSMLGRYKRKSTWDYQHEWRYKAFFLPFSVDDALQYQRENSFKQHLLALKNDHTIPFEHFDLPIDDQKFADMEIITSPIMSDTDRQEIDRMVQQFNPTATVRRSVLHLRK